MTISRIRGISSLSSAFRLVLCDLWGVVHDGRQANPEAVDCLRHFIDAGITVYLVSNAPRPSSTVVRQLQGFGIDDDCYNGVVTSGDMTRAAISGDLRIELPGAACLHLGPERDNALFEGLECMRMPWGAQPDFDVADFIVCTGLIDDEKETAEDYRSFLTEAAQRNLLLICANPDVTVMRGAVAIPCAGAIASVYESVGGNVRYFGKPYPEIYQFCLDKWRDRLASEGSPDRLAPEQVLAVGDSLRTDIAGARRMDFRSVLITDGIHSEELGAQPGKIPDPNKILEACSAAGVLPDAVMAKLAW